MLCVYFSYFSCRKDNSENMLFERINASGVGLTIGSIGTSVVNNITFRDSFMYHTWKVNKLVLWSLVSYYFIEGNLYEISGR